MTEESPRGECDPDVTCCTSCPGLLAVRLSARLLAWVSPPAPLRLPDQMLGPSCTRVRYFIGISESRKRRIGNEFRQRSRWALVVESCCHCWNMWTSLNGRALGFYAHTHARPVSHGSTGAALSFCLSFFLSSVIFIVQ